MSISPDPVAARPRDPAPTDSVRELFRETVAHGRAYVSAEKEALTLRARLTAAVAKRAALFGLVAAVLALFGLGWVLVAIVHALAHLLSAGWAALLMGVLLLVGAALCLAAVRSALRDLPGGGR